MDLGLGLFFGIGNGNNNGAGSSEGPSPLANLSFQSQSTVSTDPDTEDEDGDENENENEDPSGYSDDVMDEDENEDEDEGEEMGDVEMDDYEPTPTQAAYNNGEGPSQPRPPPPDKGKRPMVYPSSSHSFPDFSARPDLANLARALGLPSTAEEMAAEEEEETRQMFLMHAEQLKAAEAARAAITDEEISAQGVEVDPNADPMEEDDEEDDDDDDACSTDSMDIDEEKKKDKGKGVAGRQILRQRRDFFGAMAQYPELCLEISKWVRPKDLLKLYCVSKDFHETINGYLGHVISTAAATQAPECASLYKYQLYKPLCRLDPAGRLDSRGNIRWVPGLKWLQMVVHRSKAIRDILALLARQQLRLPPDVASSLKKMWLLMDISTTARRVQFMHNTRVWRNKDLYNILLFIVKLDMRFNDPVDGPGTDMMTKLFLGQRGLTPLLRALKRERFLSIPEILTAQIRYEYRVKPHQAGMPIWDIPPHEIGIGHLEGWGQGRVHLLRPDELIMGESIRRDLNLKDHIIMMMLSGYIDPITGQNIPMTEEEMYMSDDEAQIENPNWNDYEEVIRRNEDERESEGGDGEGAGEENGLRDLLGIKEKKVDFRASRGNGEGPSRYYGNGEGSSRG